MNDRGLGAIQSPPDERDFPIEQLLAERGLAGVVVLPSRFRVPYPAPVLDQGSSPQCVAYSSSRMKMWQDRTDQAVVKWWNFDEGRFFQQIGGTSDGAYLRAAMDRMLRVGYPVTGGTSPTASHRIRAYYSVPKTVDDVKRAIYQLGTVVTASPWYNSWMTPVNGVLPRPDYPIGGHAYDLEGWDDRWGFLLVNSWGTRWSAIHRGAAYLPFAYFRQAAWEVYKAVDV